MAPAHVGLRLWGGMVMATCAVLVATVVQAQSPSLTAAPAPSEAPSPKAGVEETLAPGGKAVTIGTGSVFVGQQGARQGIVLDEQQTAAAATALAGKRIGLAAPSHRSPYIDRAIAGAEAAAEALGATVLDCVSVSLTKTPTCKPAGGGPQVKIAGLISVWPTAATPLTKAQRKSGFVAVDIAGQPGGTGTVDITWTDQALGLELGRTAGAWVTAHWPDQAATVHIDDQFAYGDQTFADAVAQGLAATAPGAVVVSREGTYNDANVIILRGARIDAGLEAAVNGGYVGIAGQPLAVFSADCPEPMESAAGWSWFAGCVDYREADAGAAAVDVIARLRTGLAVPERIEAATGPVTSP